jgi:hypothetical protein
MSAPLDLSAFAARFRARRLEVERLKAEEQRTKREAGRLRTYRQLTYEVGDLTGHQDLDAIRLAKIRDNANWTPQAIVITGQYQTCTSCGHSALATGGFFLRETHKHMPFARRLRSIPNFEHDLPVECAVEGVTLPRCIKCCDSDLVDDLLESILKTSSTAPSNQLKLL